MWIFAVSLDLWQTSNQEHLLSELLEMLARTRSNGISAIVLWEDYWLSKPDIVASRLAAQLGKSVKIPARLTQARRIDKFATETFLESNHLNGNVSSKFRYGLFLPSRYYRVVPDHFLFGATADEMLVAVATFSNARIFELNNKPFRSHELIRFASLLGTNVVGAFDKLLNAFIREKSPDDVMTYADLEWSDGRSYQQLGFEERGCIAPRKVYLNPKDMSRSSRPPADDILSADGSPGYLTIYNLGSTKYVKVV